LILHTLTTTDGEPIGTVHDDVALRHLESAPPYLWPTRRHPFLVAHTDTGTFPLLVELGPGTWRADPLEAAEYFPGKEDWPTPTAPLPDAEVVTAEWRDVETLTPDTDPGYHAGYGD